jgi:hypothetical protein
MDLEITRTPRKGNLLLAQTFERAHSGRAGRELVPSFLLFDKSGTDRDVRFRGLLAPGASTNQILMSGRSSQNALRTE